MVLDCKVQGCMVPLEFQALEAQEAHEDLEPHGAHGVQVALKDLQGPAKRKKKNQTITKRHTEHTKYTQCNVAKQLKGQLLFHFYTSNKFKFTFLS